MRNSVVSDSLRAALITGICLFGFAGSAAARGSGDLDKTFTKTVRPFVNQYCAVCHSGKTPAGGLDLKAFDTLNSVIADNQRWVTVSEKLSAKQMPPAKMPQPPDAARQQVIAFVKTMRATEAKKNAGDPGSVLARRLSNAEYNYTIRDLTGVDMKPTREFPVDPANPAGFDNSGESLTMSPALLAKYLQAAREVGNHMVLTPDGIAFAPFPMLVDTDRDKYSIERIIDFYHRQPTDFADYFEAAWRYRYRNAVGMRGKTLAEVAEESKVSPKYLPMVWQILHAKDALGPVAKLQQMWLALPEPDAGKPDAVRAQCVAMRDFVVRIRRHTAMQFAAPVVRGLPAASEPLLNWKLKEFAEHRLDSDPKDLRNDTDPPPVIPVIPRYPGLHREAAPRWAALSAKDRAGDTDLIVPAAQRKQYEAAFEQFANVFPDAFYITERGRYFPDDSEDKGRLLSAGYHSVLGFFRDDIPLMKLVLDEKGQSELNQLWDDFDFISNYTARTWIQYFFNESGEVIGKGAEGGSPRPVDHAITDEAVVFGMRDKYLAKAKADPGNDPAATEAILDHFSRVNTTLRYVDKEHVSAEPKHLQALLRFAARAYRRPLTKAEQDDLLAYYHQLRTKGELSHEEAIRDSIVSVLMAPDFLYRLDLTDESEAGGGTRMIKASAKMKGAEPLSAYALANRLSYFLWSSMPDDELMQKAATGELRKKDVMMAEVRRMLQDNRARGMATEFAGNWLEFRQFETYNSVDRARYPNFTTDLREAMFEEPVRFVQDVMQNDRSVLDMLYGNYTFVNPVLAKFYGMPAVNGDNDTWVRVDDANKYGRGGLLPMSVFLTENSPGLRTSPVKRGHWLVKDVLGEIVPPPPPVVPELPSDEAKTDLPIRDLLIQHRQNPMCAACHARFDTLGLAFEGYGPVGEVRTKDLAGRKIDASADFPGGYKGVGFAGVQDYIRDRREKDFVDNLSRKLLAYALDRSLMLSDEPLVEKMQKNLVAHKYQFDSMIETIVTSSQFLERRAPEPERNVDNRQKIAAKTKKSSDNKGA